MNMSEKPQNIVICMGSSCFSRGNKKLVKVIQDYLKEHKLEDEVILKGTHCMGHCDKGPVMQIDEEKIFHITDTNLIDILSNKLLNEDVK
ncbi:MAG: (2Fe-2S) ferredoxin domain-containing protein [Bacteroidetes bacterium]|nr:MAG: (2Fe-2S) ferredoxin domain-containing protein [Bacteroidota bacterium]